MHRIAKVVALGSLSCLCTLSPLQAQEQALPALGDSSSAIVTAQQEHYLGRAWLQALRRQAPTIDDPEMKEYTESLIYRLVETSEVRDRRLEVVILDSPELNAFAVPGGIVGINSGLFLYADSEQEFASVLAHELAHLSQRHFARNVEEAERNRIPSLAATLASVLLMAAGGGDAGIATLATSQAAFQSQQMKFSRQNEREADNVGIQNLARANMDPRAMPSMFESMNRASRFSGQKPPEFLSTHPVTENRISESRARAEQYPLKHYQDNPSYHLMRVKAQIHHNRDINKLIERYESELKNGSSTPPFAVRYGLALALTKAQRLDEAEQALAPLLKEAPDNRHYLIAQALIDSERGQYAAADKRLKGALELTPENLPLTMNYANILVAERKYKPAEQLLSQLVSSRPNDPDVWYILAEVRGLAKDITGVHLARAEFFRLTGDLDQAIQHLEYAQTQVQGNFALTTKVEQQIKDLRAYQKDVGF
ncbi:M48 family metalloprotease [Aestuariirhabdus litorea]|uniref:Putative beta-barrel assembly-enhancing protease n=1 Tax=Aestuariirhabdus litorea TaxID=2528527 RepID=A0A3P3VN43_9GAMM|nr:M48 family metalloprotease [Aestuariirhabdus litorea]RRJ84182.1 M48 family peptidase [Aestuariirhabdus litorea]RWW97402.1 tetratricopeptide repeat protein [Endozoicomonadaceae bacterium GTF-13]